MLCADGTRDGSIAGIEQAIFAYNHARWYVSEVMTWTETYAVQDTSGPAASRPATAQETSRDQRTRRSSATAPAAPSRFCMRDQPGSAGRHPRVGAAHGSSTTLNLRRSRMTSNTDGVATSIVPAAPR